MINLNCFFSQNYNQSFLLLILDAQNSVRWILEGIGLAKYVDIFEESDCQYDDFLNMTNDDFKALGIPHFPQKRIKKEINRLKGTTSPGTH